MWSAVIRTSRTNSPKLPHRPKGDVYTLGSKNWRPAGGPGRDLSTLMELQLNKVLCVYFLEPLFVPNHLRLTLWSLGALCLWCGSASCDVRRVLYKLLMMLHWWVMCTEQIRIQHEVYPENTVQASRQVLIISDLEIRDRLALSKINKFLYQYSSDALPRQSHASMVTTSQQFHYY